MQRNANFHPLAQLAIAMVLSAPAAALAETNLIHITAANFTTGPNMSAFDGTNYLRFVIDPATAAPFCQSAVKQSTAPALLGPNPQVPYFTVRFAMPIPPAYTTSEVAALVSLGLARRFPK